MNHGRFFIPPSMFLGPREILLARQMIFAVIVRGSPQEIKHDSSEFLKNGCWERRKSHPIHKYTRQYRLNEDQSTPEGNILIGPVAYPFFKPLYNPQPVIYSIPKQFQKITEVIEPRMERHHSIRQDSQNHLESQWHYYISIQNPTARGFLFLNLPKITRIHFFFCKCGHKCR